MINLTENSQIPDSNEDEEKKGDTDTKFWEKVNLKIEQSKLDEVEK